MFTHDRDTKRAEKADIRELEKREGEPRDIQRFEPPGPPPERRG